MTYSLLSIGAVVSGAVVYSTFWILHNKRIAKRGKRGFVSFYKTPQFKSDALGRQLTLLPVQHDKYDPVIIVRQSGNQKEYVAEKPAALGKGVEA